MYRFLQVKYQLLVFVILLILGFSGCGFVAPPVHKDFETVIGDQGEWEVRKMMVYAEDNYYDGVNFDQELLAEYKDCGELLFDSNGDATYSYGTESHDFTWSLDYDQTNGSYMFVRFDDEETVFESSAPLLYYLTHNILETEDNWVYPRDYIVDYMRVVSAEDNFIMLRIRLYGEGMIDFYLIPKS